MKNNIYKNTNNFWSGFFLGSILVFIAIFLLGTKRGREFLKKILEISENWETKIDEILKEIETFEVKKEVEKEIKSLPGIITKIKNHLTF
jgi:gas vesicle protein